MATMIVASLPPGITEQKGEGMMDIILCGGGGFGQKLALSAKAVGRRLDLVMVLTDEQAAFDTLAQNPPMLLVVWEHEKSGWSPDFVRACRGLLSTTKIVVVKNHSELTDGWFARIGEDV